MIQIAGKTGMDFFRINGEQVKVSDATVLIGVSGGKGLGHQLWRLWLCDLQ